MNKVKFFIQEVAYWSKTNGHSERFTNVYSAKTGESISIDECSGNVRHKIRELLDKTGLNPNYPAIIEARTSWENYKDFRRLHKFANPVYDNEFIVDWIIIHI